jgi:hypothetical protein
VQSEPEPLFSPPHNDLYYKPKGVIEAIAALSREEKRGISRLQQETRHP